MGFPQKLPRSDSTAQQRSQGPAFHTQDALGPEGRSRGPGGTRGTLGEGDGLDEKD